MTPILSLLLAYEDVIAVSLMVLTFGGMLLADQYKGPKVKPLKDEE